MAHIEDRWYKTAPVLPATYNSTAWIPARNAAGMTSGGPHQLRHFYASALQVSVVIKALSEYLGHHDPVITLRIYAHPDALSRGPRATGDRGRLRGG